MLICLEMYENVATGVLVERTLGGGGVVTARGDNPPGELKGYAFDNNVDTKWLDFSVITWIQYEFPSSAAYAISSYKITSGNDADGRDPKDWILKGSNDGTTFYDLDTRTGELWTDRKQERSFSFSNTTSYKMYRLSISATRGDGLTQITEIRLFEST